MALAYGVGVHAVRGVNQAMDQSYASHQAEPSETSLEDWEKVDRTRLKGRNAEAGGRQKARSAVVLQEMTFFHPRTQSRVGVW